MNGKPYSSTSMVTCDTEDLILSYLKHAMHITKNNERLKNIDVWAVAKVDELVDNDPLIALMIVIELVERADDECVISYIAAGPLENLINDHGLEIIDSLEASARKSKRLQEALLGVWPASYTDTSVWKRVLKFREPSKLFNK